mmetsp:Transcript_9137/g.25077  ORF Transcript_9137/g.25077 Transcript_9137/m.25077 type:complete len:227 (-) Transcript_9137:207-887(-)
MAIPSSVAVQVLVVPASAAIAAFVGLVRRTVCTVVFVRVALRLLVLSVPGLERLRHLAHDEHGQAREACAVEVEGTQERAHQESQTHRRCSGPLQGNGLRVIEVRPVPVEELLGVGNEAQQEEPCGADEGRVRVAQELLHLVPRGPEGQCLDQQDPCSCGLACCAHATEARAHADGAVRVVGTAEPRCASVLLLDVVVHLVHKLVPGPHCGQALEVIGAAYVLEEQ